jgi:hypothetical protein
MIQLQAREYQMPWTRDTHHSVGGFGTSRINLLLSDFNTPHHVNSELPQLLNR